MMEKRENKKKGTDVKNIKKSFRVVKDSPAISKISQADIEKAVEKAIALSTK